MKQYLCKLLNISDVFIIVQGLSVTVGSGSLDKNIYNLEDFWGIMWLLYTGLLMFVFIMQGFSNICQTISFDQKS